MPNLNQKIKETSQNLLNENKSFVSTAKIIQTDEKNNCCTIDYLDYKGQKNVQTGVMLKISDPKMPSYFPNVGDIVYIESYKDTLLITGPYMKHENTMRNGMYKTEYNTLYHKNFGVYEGSIL